MKQGPVQKGGGGGGGGGGKSYQSSARNEREQMSKRVSDKMDAAADADAADSFHNRDRDVLVCPSSRMCVQNSGQHTQLYQLT